MASDDNLIEAALRALCGNEVVIEWTDGSVVAAHLDEVIDGRLVFLPRGFPHMCSASVSKVSRVSASRAVRKLDPPDVAPDRAP